MGNEISTTAVDTAQHWLQGSGVENDIVARKRNDQGNHECQVLADGHEAAESGAAWRACKKNPGHATFIPAADFSMEHLPGPCRDEAVLGLVRIMSALSVRLTVGYTSTQRPAHGYTFSNCRGTNLRHTGSGCVYQARTGDGPCPCSSCSQSSSPPAITWYRLHVMTACHAVFDSEEARATKVDFFYDDERSLQDGRVRSMQGVKVLRTDVEKDTSEMMCATHDRGLFETLQAHLQQQQRLGEAIDTNRRLADWRDRLCVVVSHPHGQPKRITVGEVKRRVAVRGKFEVTFFYTADTCTGSSGALVLHLDNCGRGAENLVYWLPPHSEGKPGEGVNMSGQGWVMKRHR